MNMALRIEKDCKEISAPELAATYLNLCAVYSELQQHAEAADKAVKSVMLIRNYLQKLKMFDAHSGNNFD